MDGKKPWYESSTVWGGAIAVAASGARLLGYTVTPDDQATLAAGASHLGEIVTSGAALIGGAVAIWGRVRASKAIAVKSA